MSLEEILLSPIRWELIDYHSKGLYDNEICGKCQQWYNVYSEKINNNEFSAEISTSSQNYFTKKKLELIP